MVPPRVAFLIWTLIRSRFLAVEFLKRRGIQMANRFDMCNAHEETIQHVFVDYVFTKSVCMFFGNTLIWIAWVNRLS